MKVNWAELLADPALYTMAIDEIVEHIPVDDIIASALFPTGDRPYARRLLYHGAVGEALVMGWGDGHSCAPHDHGNAQGIVAFLRGEGREIRWYSEGKGVRPGAVNEYRAPAVMSVEVEEVHSMTTRGRAVTLHLYRPAIVGMRVFDPLGRRTLRVADSCGAWIPADDEILEIIPW